MQTKSARGSSFETKKEHSNLSETPLVNNRNTLLFGTIAAVILYFLYTREGQFSPKNEADQHYQPYSTHDYEH